MGGERRSVGKKEKGKKREAYIYCIRVRLPIAGGREPVRTF